MVKNRLVKLLSMIVAGIFLISCNEPAGSYTLPDGTEISAEEVEILESLIPEVEKIYTDILGTSRSLSIANGEEIDISFDEIQLLNYSITQ